MDVIFTVPKESEKTACIFSASHINGTESSVINGWHLLEKSHIYTTPLTLSLIDTGSMLTLSVAAIRCAENKN